MGKRAHSDPRWVGMVDDARIYNYELSPFEVAELYTDIRTDEVVCAEPLPMDLNDDCFVDMLDIAIFAADYLECNLVPDCK